MKELQGITVCKNCQHPFEGNYCNHCGQSADTHRMSWHFLLYDIQHGLFHFDKGLLYTIPQLFIRPGHAIREFIEGKRVQHFKPLTLVIVLATLYGVLFHYFGIEQVPGFSISGNAGKGIRLEKINEWMANHFAWTTLLGIPLFALPTYLVFRKQGYNFIEHLVLNAFLAGQRLFVRVAALPLVYLVSGPSRLQTMPKVIIWIDLLLTVWSYVQFFDKLPLKKTLLLTLLAYLVFAMLVITIAALFMLGVRLSLS